jgi:hypothetical protein
MFNVILCGTLSDASQLQDLVKILIGSDRALANGGKYGGEKSVVEINSSVLESAPPQKLSGN